MFFDRGKNREKIVERFALSVARFIALSILKNKLPSFSRTISEFLLLKKLLN